MEKIEKYLEKIDKLTKLHSAHAELKDSYEKMKGNRNYAIATSFLSVGCLFFTLDNFGESLFANIVVISTFLIWLTSISFILLVKPKEKKLIDKMTKLSNEINKCSNDVQDILDKLEKEELFYYIENEYEKLNQETQEILHQLTEFLENKKSNNEKKEDLLEKLKSSKMAVRINND